MTEKELDCFASKEKEVKIGKDVFVVKELNYKEKNEIRKGTIKYDAMTGKTDFDMFTSNELKLLKGLKSAPFEINEVNLGRLKESVVSKLLLSINELSEVSEEEAKK